MQQEHISEDFDKPLINKSHLHKRYKQPAKKWNLSKPFPTLLWMVQKGQKLISNEIMTTQRSS